MNGRQTSHTLLAGVAAAFLLVSGVAATGSTMASATLRTECLKRALQKPRAIRPAVMYHAGARPNTRLRLKEQLTLGTYEYPALPVECAKAYKRFTGAKLEVRRHRSVPVWQSLTKNWGERATSGNDTQLLGPELERAYGLTPWSPWQWNECVNGKFQRVRLRLRNQAISTISRHVIAQRIYTVSVPVRGNCWAARVSAWETEGCVVKKKGGVETSVCKHCVFKSQRYHGIRCERLPANLRRGRISATTIG